MICHGCVIYVEFLYLVVDHTTFSYVTAAQELSIVGPKAFIGHGVHE